MALCTGCKAEGYGRTKADTDSPLPSNHHFRISFSDGLAIGGIVFSVVLLRLDKAEKLHGPTLLVLLAIAALMTIPLAIGNKWVYGSSSRMMRLARSILMIVVVGACYYALSRWINTNAERSEE